MVDDVLIYCRLFVTSLGSVACKKINLYILTTENCRN